MTPSRIIRAAEWLVPDDERGEAILGDLEEVYADWQASRGPMLAALGLVWELARSCPALVRAAFVERGGAALLLRSVPALVAGGLLFAGPIGLSKSAAVAGTSPAIVLGIAAVAGFAIAGGWLAAALAGAAPRQHGLALGVGLVLLGLTMAAIGRGDLPPWYWILLHIPVLPAAAYGGQLYWRSTRLRDGSQPRSA
jgi:hypothetical protein